jgi:hypothetical protein
LREQTRAYGWGDEQIRNENDERFRRQRGETQASWVEEFVYRDDDLDQIIDEFNSQNRNITSRVDTTPRIPTISRFIEVTSNGRTRTAREVEMHFSSEHMRESNRPFVLARRMNSDKQQVTRTLGSMTLQLESLTKAIMQIAALQQSSATLKVASEQRNSEIQSSITKKEESQPKMVYTQEEKDAFNQKKKLAALSKKAKSLQGSSQQQKVKRTKPKVEKPVNSVILPKEQKQNVVVSSSMPEVTK